jgi:hypothetical protein
MVIPSTSAHCIDQHGNTAGKRQSGFLNSDHVPTVTIRSAGIQGPYLPGVHKYRHNIELLLHTATRLTELSAGTCRPVP